MGSRDGRCFFSILRDTGIDLIRPAQNPALQIHEFAFEAGTLKRVDRACASSTHFAVNYCLTIWIDLVHTVQHLAQRNMNRVWYAAIREFVVLTNVNDLNVVAFVETLFEFS